MLSSSSGISALITITPDTLLSVGIYFNELIMYFAGERYEM